MDRHFLTISTRFAAFLLVALLLGACGGGGGGGTPPTNNDSDGDGIANAVDNCPTVANAGQTDSDGDGAGNACDADDDNDGVPDTMDAFPLDPDESADSDSDGVGDNGDNCPAMANNDQADNDSDGLGDVCDADDDNDGVSDDVDNCPTDANADQADGDNDGIGDVCDDVTDVMVSGKATYDFVPHNTVTNGLNYAATSEQPIRFAEVEIIEVATGAVLANADTDAAGDYSALVPADTDVYVRVRAESIETGTPAWEIRILDNTSGNALYVLESANFNSGPSDIVQDLHADSGWGGADYTAVRAAAPFAILDSLVTATEGVLGVDPVRVFPPLVAKWSPLNNTTEGDETAGEIGNTFFRRTLSGDREILLLGAKDADTDEYDRHIVIHEWGHYFEDTVSRADTIGGAHSAGDRLDPRVAYSEGWGYAWAGIATGDPVSRDSLGTGQSMGFSIDVEENDNTNPGWYSEGSVQSILYDIVDSASDGVDNLTLGFAPVYEILSGELASSVPPITIFSFVTLLRAQLPPGQQGDLDTIVGYQDIVASPIDLYGSAETNDAGRGADVLPVYSTLTVGGPAVNVCSLGDPEPTDFGSYNKLSVRRFLKLNIASSGTYQFTAEGPSAPAECPDPNWCDPDIAIHQQGLLLIAEDVGPTEIETVALSSGDYVIEVYEFSNLTDTPRGKTCIDVSVVAQ